MYQSQHHLRNIQSLGAPNKNMATETFELGLAQAIATNYSAVVCYMDVKGTPGRGQLFHHNPYLDLEVNYHSAFLSSLFKP